MVWIQLSLEFPFLVFHVSVTACVLCRMRKKETSFNTLFFKLYSMQSFAEVNVYVIIVMCNRLARVGYTTTFLANSYPLWDLANFSFRFAASFQFTTHAIIAVNRYKIFAHPVATTASRIDWKVLALLFIPPIPLSVDCFLGRLTARPTDVPGVYALTYEPRWIVTIRGLFFAGYSITSALLSVVFEVRTFVLYHRFDAKQRRKHREDYHLLVYAFTQFVAQSLVATYNIMQCVIANLHVTILLREVQEAYPYVIDLLCLSSPVFLVLTSPAFRRRYLVFYKLRRANSTVTPVGHLRRIQPLSR